MSDMIPKNVLVSIRENGSLKVETINEEPTMTQQHYEADCNINNIIKKYGPDPARTFPELARKTGMYLDLVGITDYQQMLETVRYADMAFNSMPAELRNRFENDPARLIAFLNDRKNLDEAISLGLVSPKTQNAQTEKATSDKSPAKNAKSGNKAPVEGRMDSSEANE